MRLYYRQTSIGSLGSRGLMHYQSLAASRSCQSRKRRSLCCTDPGFWVWLSRWYGRVQISVAACSYNHPWLIITATSIKIIPIRLFITARTIKRLVLHVLDITKALIMSSTTLRRPVFIQAPRETMLEKRCPESNPSNISCNGVPYTLA